MDPETASHIQKHEESFLEVNKALKEVHAFFEEFMSFYIPVEVDLRINGTIQKCIVLMHKSTFSQQPPFSVVENN